MSERLGADDLLRMLETDAEKLEALCEEFKCLLTQDQFEECSLLDLEPPLEGEDQEVDDSEGLASSDEEFLSSCDRVLVRSASPASSLTTSSSSTSSSSSTVRSFPSPVPSRRSQDSECDDSPTALTAISLAKVLLTGTIPRLKHIVRKHLEDPSGAGPSIAEIREKYETFRTVTCEALRRFSVLRQNRSLQSDPSETEP